MKQSLRKTPSHLHLAYKYGEASDSLTGRNLTLEIDGAQLLLTIDLGANFHTRTMAAAAYVDAVTLARDHHKLRYLQCSDNLVRARLIRAWERVELPRLLLQLDLGPRGRFVYAVQPHSLFIGGIQFDVLRVLDDHDFPGHGILPERHSIRNHA